MNLVPLMLAVLGGGAAGSVMLARRPRAALCVSLASIVVAAVGSCVAALRVLLGAPRPDGMCVGWALPIGPATLVLDSLSAWFLLVIGVVTTAVAIYSWDYFRSAVGHEAVWAATALLGVLVAALVMTVCAGDVVTFMVGWELMSLSAFLLVGFHHREPRSRHGAWMYLVSTHLATACGVLPMFAAFAAATSSVSFAQFGGAFDASQTAVCTVVFLLGLLGFGTKAGFMPMHVWLPVAHPAAPTPVSALLSGVVIKIGIYGLLRLLSWLPPLPAGCAMTMLSFGMVSGVAGVLYALAQHDLKRLLAYHSVENIGIIGLGIGAGMLGQTLGQPALIALGYGGALLHVLNHALFKGLLFLSAGAVVQATATGNLDRLGGLARQTPVNAALFLLGAISICGLPPFNGFVSEWLLYGSLFSSVWGASRMAGGFAAMGAAALALMGGLALACFAKVVSVVFLGEPRDRTVAARRTPWSMRSGMFLPAILCTAIGILPGIVVPLTAAGVRSVTGLETEDHARQMQSILAPAGRLTLLTGILLGAIVSVSYVRWLLLRRGGEAVAAPHVTWGCGFARPTARMQYTASSFAWSLIQSFRSLLWPHRHAVAPAGPFPGHAALESHTPDMAEHDFFAPLLRGIGRVFRMIRNVSWSGEPASHARPDVSGARAGPLRVLSAGLVTGLRQGRVHVYLAFIVLTLLVVFFVEAQSARESSESPEPPAVHSRYGGRP